ncbi:hypothetical protein QAD02_018562 [Eretmocerus hayati]|uniref:Uncharacterized protein n=1 Tax=Eretmocerus hayati TaxID=131215 RepID=A0ACC2PLX5_9HYME|nr:hypothetical protein QAD02_018562 [Eretmocerus hayati]
MSHEILDPTNIFDNVSPIFWKKGRLQTFEHWPFSSDVQCNPDSMAAAGFYAIGGKDEPDLAECFMCGKQLDGWEPDDDPWQEHKKHQSNCPFISLGKKNEGSMTVKELFQLIATYSLQKKRQEYEKALEEVKKNVEEATNSIPQIYENIKKSKKSLN